MGIVTWSTVIAADGSVRREEGWAPGDQVALHYDYGPGLLPGPDDGPGMWRYRNLLPLADGTVCFPLPVGGTPLVAPPVLRRHLGLPNLWLKDETRSPSCSNKDRATALVIEHAMRDGTHTVTCASTGNVAVSVAVGAAAAGIRALIFVPAEVSPGKLSVMLATGATVVLVEEGYEAAFRLSREAARRFGWFDRNTGVNPVTLEGKKTVAFEIWEQLGRAPDVVLVPAGDGTTLCGMAKGFWELKMCGAIERLPRIIGVQAEGCQPLKHAWETGEMPPCAGLHTVADGIAVVRPSSGSMALHAVRESGGAFIAVSDAAILEGVGLLARAAGVIAEPAAAAATAAVLPAMQSGLISQEEVVVSLVTGSGLKTPQYLQPAGVSWRVQGHLDELEAVMERGGENAS